MGVYQTASIQVTVPADRVASLAEAIRQAEKRDSGDYWYERAKDWADVDVVAWYLCASEGGGENPSHEYFSDNYSLDADGNLQISAWIDGKVGYDNDEIERLYAAHGAFGIIEGVCEGENYLCRIKDGQVRAFRGEVVYPGDTDLAGLHEIVKLADRLATEHSNDDEIDALRIALERALDMVPGYDRQEDMED